MVWKKISCLRKVSVRSHYLSALKSCGLHYCGIALCGFCRAGLPCGIKLCGLPYGITLCGLQCTHTKFLVANTWKKQQAQHIGLQYRLKLPPPEIQGRVQYCPFCEHECRDDCQVTEQSSADMNRVNPVIFNSVTIEAFDLSLIEPQALAAKNL